MKKQTKVLAGMLAASMILGMGSAVTVGAEEHVSGEITVWTKLTQEEIDTYVRMYNEINPDVKINTVVLPGDAYPAKLQQALRSGSGAPDVFTSEIKQFDGFKDTDLVENLSAEPYNVADEEENMVPYVAELSKDSEGNFKGLSYQSCPGGFWYNKKLAKEYLGTDDPDELSAMWTSWDDIPEVCAEVYEKSGGSVYLLDSLETFSSMLIARRTAPHVVDNKLYDVSFYQDCMDRAMKVRENHGDTMTTAWDASWANGMYNEQNFILLGLPSWGLHYVIKANTPADATDTDGTWGFCQAPSPYESGGTWLSMYSKSENKEAAWDFIRTMTLDKEFLTKYVEETGDMICYTPVIEEVIESGFRDSFTGDQPIYEYEYEAAMNITPIDTTKYDQAVEDTFHNKMRMAAAGGMTSEEAIQAFVEDLQTQFPELVVE